MESSPFRKLVKFNYWLYNRDRDQLAETIRERNSLKKLLKALIEYRDIVVHTSDWAFGLTHQGLISLVQEGDRDYISAITWEIDYLDRKIDRFRERLVWQKKQPIWIPLG